MKRLALAALAGIAAELCGIGLTACAAWLIATAAGQPTLAALSLAIVAVRAFATFRGPFRYIERLAGHDAALHLLAELRGRVFDALARSRGSARSGAALSRVVSDADSVQDLLLRGALPTVIAAVAGISALALALVLLPLAGLVLAAGILIGGALIPVLAALTTRRLGSALGPARADLATHTLDLVDGGRDLEAYGMRPAYAERAHDAALRLARLERLSGAVGGLATALGVLVQGATVIGLALVALPHGPVMTAVLALTGLVAVEAALPLAGAAQSLAELLPAWRRIRSLLTTSAPDGTPLPAVGSSLSLRNVHVRYGGVTALDGVSLALDASGASGRAVGIVGASGAGKSTLLSVIAGQVAPSSGSVTVPGTVRGLFQDAHVFAASVRTNLLLGRPAAADDDLWRALTLAGLTDLPLETVVGEGGRALSGGERQRLLLARALLADPPVLLLDEPGESLHHELSDALLRDILAARRGRTTVVVTHRLAGLAAVDEIVVMDGGRIVQRGPHERLIEEPGPYAGLWEAERLHAA